MSEFIDFPATSESGTKTIPIGVHRMTIVKMEKAVDKKNQPILDNRNYPAIRMVFQTTDGLQIDSIFHYSPKPENDPTRNDPQLMCKSEFRLFNLKRAMGFGTGPVRSELIKGKWFYGMIYGEMWVHEANGEPVLRDEKDAKSKIIFNRLGSIFWPDNVQKPIKEGDPTIPSNNGIPSGDFIKVIKKKYADVQKFLAKEKDSDEKPSGPSGKTEFADDFNSAPESQGQLAPENQQAPEVPESKNQAEADW